MFEAYFDESGTDCPVFAVSGFVGPADEWTAFAQEWETIIKHTGVTAYHAADCEGGYSEFDGWPKEKREALTVALVDCLEKRRIFGIGMSAIVEDFKAVMPWSPKTLWRDLYATLFEIALIVAVQRMIERAPGQHLAVICDYQEEFDAVGKRVFQELKDDAEWDHRYKLESILFAPKTCFLPLQAADKAAYETYRQYSNQFYDPKRAARMAMYRFFDFPFYTAYCNRHSFLGLKNQKAKTSDLLPWVEELFLEHKS